MKRHRLRALVLVGAAALVGCESDFMVPDLNNPGLESLEGNPSRAAVIDAAQGLLIGARAGIAGQTGYIAHLGILGRESYTFDNSDPRYWDEMVAGALDPGNGAFGGSGWAPRYANIRNANIILNSLDAVTGFTPEELESIRGFAKTIQALDLQLVVNMRDANGAVIDVNRPIGDELAPFVSRDQALDEVVRLLDEANAHLLAGGASFPFQLSSGFADFNTPAAFAEVNRALKARAQVAQDDYSGALTSLSSSFVSDMAAMDLGVYHAYGTASGDVANGLFQGSDPQIIAHPSILTDADAGDQRAAAKTSLLPEAVTNRGLTTDVRFEIYPAQSSPVPIIRNEELLLLRAEARWFTGDPTGAMEDLNAVRTTSGGLGAIGTPGSDDAFVDALLYERRYSLLMEGQRWLDHRRFDRLGDLVIDRAGDVVPVAFPVPRAECVARNLAVPCGV